jgi:hypothetical protein
MTIRSGLIVAIRCFMLVFGLYTLLVAVSVASTSDFTVVSRLAAIAAIGSVFVPLLLIYWFAGWIVDAMTPKGDDVRPETSIKLDDLQAIAFSAVGAYVLYLAVRDTIGLLTVMGRVRPFDLGNVGLSYFLNPLVAWLMGLYLLIGAPGIRRWVGNLRRAGPSSEKSE